MDIAIIGKNNIKIKGRETTFVVDPTKDMPKTPADAIILLNGFENIDTSKVTDFRLIINGAGGYEVGGSKISGTKTSKGTLYKILIDDVSIILGFATDAKMEGFNASQVAVVNTNGDFNDSFVTALEPKMVLLYGEKSKEEARALGAENVNSSSKVSITKDKLPEKTEVIVLG